MLQLRPGGAHQCTLPRRAGPLGHPGNVAHSNAHSNALDPPPIPTPAFIETVPVLPVRRDVAHAPVLPAEPLPRLPPTGPPSQGAQQRGRHKELAMDPRADEGARAALCSGAAAQDCHERFKRRSETCHRCQQRGHPARVRPAPRPAPLYTLRPAPSAFPRPAPCAPKPFHALPSPRPAPRPLHAHSTPWAPDP